MAQCCFSTDDRPIITNLTVIRNSTTAIFNCSFTGHPPPSVIWFTPGGLTSVVDGNQLIVTQLGPEASGIYQCFVTNNIRCDHKEIHLNVSAVSIATSSNISVSVIDSSSVDSSSALISPTPSSSSFHTLLLLATSHISSSSAFISPSSSVISDSSSSISLVFNRVPSSSASISVTATNLACNPGNKIGLLSY